MTLESASLEEELNKQGSSRKISASDLARTKQLENEKNKDLTPAEVANEMRRELINLLQENLTINASQLT